MKIYSSKAAKFDEKDAQVRYMHLNINFEHGLPENATGPLAELAGTQAMSGATAAMLHPASPVGKGWTMPYVDPAGEREEERQWADGSHVVVGSSATWNEPVAVGDLQSLFPPKQPAGRDLRLSRFHTLLGLQE